MFQSSAPVSLPGMVGRDGDIAAIREALDQHRLVAILGCGGVGKSRLARAVSETSPDPALFVPLAAISEADAVLAEVVRHAGWATTTVRCPLDLLADHIGQQRALIVLDNIEQIKGLGTVLHEFLDACPGVRLLTTTQVPLDDALEFVVPLDPLKPAAALEMLGSIAAEVRPGSTDRADDDTFRAICQRLDHLPLAIELAGAQLRIAAPGELLGLLDQRLDVLRRRAPSPSANQETLRAAIEWSAGLLSVAGRRGLYSLAVFSGGFGLSGAVALLGRDTPATLDVLHELVEHQIVRVVPSSTAESRFDIPETLRLFGVEQAQRGGFFAQVCADHAEWCVQLVADLLPTGTESGPAFDALEVEHDNLRAAVGYLIEHPDDAGGAALWLVARLRRFWWTRTAGNEGRLWTERAIAACSGGVTVALAEAWEALGALAEEHGDVQACEQAYDRAILLFDELGDRRGLARCLNSFGLVCRHRGDLDGATGLHRQALEIFEELGDEHGCVRALDRLAGAAYFAGDLVAAAELWEQTLPYLRRVGDQRGLASTLGNLGAVILGRGQPRRALAAHLEVLRIQEALGERSAIGRTQVNLGECALVLGDLDEADRWLTVALETTRNNDDRYPQAEALLLLGRVAKQRGAWADAVARMIESYDLCGSTGQHAGAGRALINAAILAGDDGRHALAASLLAAADQVSDESTVVGVESDERQRCADAAVEALTFEQYQDAVEGRLWSAERARSEVLALGTMVSNDHHANAQRETPTTALRSLGLSPREAEVAELLARRFTDQEIATELFISLRTAGAHVSAVLRKLELSSRRQVGSALADHGIDLGI